MSVCIEKLGHSCGSSDALQVFADEDGAFTGYCFACDTYVPNPYEGLAFHGVEVKEKPQKDVDNELRDLDALNSVAFPDRKLRVETLEYFGIRAGLSQTDGATVITHHYPYAKDSTRRAYKTRLVETKQFWAVGDIKNVDLFGWDQALATGAKRLYITEGGLDAAALFQALKSKSRGTVWEQYNPAVVSLIGGAKSAKKGLSDNVSAIRSSFQEVVLVFDKDEPGEEAVKDAMTVMPMARTINLPAKDPNECLVQGRGTALANAALFKSATPKNTRLVWGSALHEAGRQTAEWGLSWPWDGMTELTRGMRYGETYYLGAGVKMGKSEMVNTLGAHLIVEHDLKVFMAKPEEANPRTYKTLCGKVAGRIFHDPNVEFDYDAYDRASKLVGDNLCVLDLYQHLGWESLRADILVAVEQGCRAVFIDPITNLVNGIASGETNTILQEIAQELAALAKDLDIIIFIFCHLKAPLTGASHERGGKVLSHQFSGSRAMMRSCNMMIGLEGNKDPDIDIDQRNMRKLVILEDREFGASGFIRLFWDKNTSLFNEVIEK